MRLRNIILAIRDQGPSTRFIRNLCKGHLWGLVHKNSHVPQGTGKPKVMYNTKATAVKSAAGMTKRTVSGSQTTSACTVMVIT